MQHQQPLAPPAAAAARSRPPGGPSSRPIEATDSAAAASFGLLTPSSQGNGLINGTLQSTNNSPDLIRGSPITRHSYVNQAVNFSPAHLQQQNQIVRYVCTLYRVSHMHYKRFALLPAKVPY